MYTLFHPESYIKTEMFTLRIGALITSAYVNISTMGIAQIQRELYRKHGMVIL